MRRLTAKFKFHLKNKFVKTTTRQTEMRKKNWKSRLFGKLFSFDFLISRHFVTIFRNISTSPSITWINFNATCTVERRSGIIWEPGFTDLLYPFLERERKICSWRRCLLLMVKKCVKGVMHIQTCLFAFCFWRSSLRHSIANAKIYRSY